MSQIPRSTLVPAALLAGLCPLVANSIHEDSTGDGARILAEAAAGLSGAATISIVLFLVGFAALIVVLGVLAAGIARHTPALSGIVAVASLPDGNTAAHMVMALTAGTLLPATVASAVVRHRLLDQHAVLTARLEAVSASRQALVIEREDDRMRLRRDLHDGLGPGSGGAGAARRGGARPGPSRHGRHHGP